MTVEVVTPDDVEADESTPGVVRRTMFETETAVMVQSHIAGGTTSGWHHHGERHTYGYVIEGLGRLNTGLTVTRHTKAGPESSSVSPPRQSTGT